MQTTIKVTVACSTVLIFLLTTQGQAQIKPGVPSQSPLPSPTTDPVMGQIPTPMPSPMTIFPTNRSEGQDYKVKVKSVVEKTTPDDKVVYDVSYSYEFKGRATVWVDGLGAIPGKGKFNYMTSDNKVEFRESANGPLIVGAGLEET